VYAQDLAVAVGWMVALKKGVDPGKIIEKIRSSETDKCFGDYWRSGVWGEKELRALKELQAQVLKYAVKRL
jgi:hypothetical protein